MSWVGKEKHGVANSGDVDFLQGMSGTLNHSPSMDFSDPRRPEGALGPHSVLQPAGVPHQQHSPLQHFVQVVVKNYTGLIVFRFAGQEEDQ